MKCFFKTCTDAIDYAINTNSFGAFYSDKKNQNPNVHIHECCEVFLCLGGGRSFLIDNKVYDINDGDLFIMNQFEAHKVVPSDKDEFSRYILHIHPSFLYTNSTEDINLADCFYSSEKIAKISLTKDELENMLSFFVALSEEHTYADEMYKKLRVIEILLEINKLFLTHTRTTPYKFSHKSIQLSIDYINNNFSSPITLENIAKNAFVSPTQLSRLFRRYCGTTVAKYITGKRIAEAKKLLLSGKTVTETAFMCGFNDYATFFRNYISILGYPPSEERGILSSDNIKS